MDSSKKPPLMSKNSDLKDVIEASKKKLQSTEPSAGAKVDRSKMIENSRQKFYKNLNIQMKESGGKV